MSQYGDTYFLGLLEDSLQCTNKQTLVVRANPQAEGGVLAIMPMPTLQSACCKLLDAEFGLCSPLPTGLRQLQVEVHTDESNSHQKYTKMYVQQLIACCNTGAGAQSNTKGILDGLALLKLKHLTSGVASLLLADSYTACFARRLMLHGRELIDLL